MIKLEEVKVALFDFDDTLCIHKNHASSTEKQHRLHHASIVRKELSMYSECTTSKHLKAFMLECKEKGVKLGLISATPSFAFSQVKHDWVLQKYGIDLENYCVGTFEAKLDVMIAISDAYKIPRSSILLVDDYFRNNKMSADAGFMVCTPMEVVNYIENSQFQK